MKLSFLLLMMIIFSAGSVIAQEKPAERLYGYITLDSVVISAVEEGFDVDDFISLIRNDTSFYHAFRNLRFYPYAFKSDIRIYAPNGKVKASYNGTLQQEIKKRESEYCRWLTVTEEKTTGNFFDRKGAYNYYTAEMFAYLFLTEDTACKKKTPVSGEEVNTGSKMEKHKERLKTLIFNPGAEVEGVPVAGNKLAIFDEQYTALYDYTITSKASGDKEYFVFSVKKKEGLNFFEESQTVINSLETFFDKETFEVMARNYDLSYSSILFDFDVKMNVSLKKSDGVLLVEEIVYDGHWDIPFKKPEIADFRVNFYDFKTAD